MRSPSFRSIAWRIGASFTRVFSGGACNILNDAGELLRNAERDAINDDSVPTSRRMPETAARFSLLRSSLARTSTC